jgi:hypothetical protein
MTPHAASVKVGPTRRAALAAFALSGLVPAAKAQDARDRLGIPGPLTFDGESYALAWSSQPSPNYTKQEYLPAGQATGSYASMLLVEVVEGEITVEAALGAQLRLLNARKGSDPLVNFSAIRNRKTGEAMLDFIIGGRTPQGAAIAEWNAYRYAPRRQGGVMLFAISRRAYGEADIRAFLARLKDERPGLVNRLAQQTLPVERR